MSFDTTGLIERRNRRGTRYFKDVDGEVVAKECTNCSIVKDWEKDFDRDISKTDGKNPRCKACTAEYRASNKKRRAEYTRNWQKVNPGYTAEYNRKWRKENEEYIQEYNRLNKERHAKAQRKWYEENKERVLERERKRRKNNLDKYAGYEANRRARVQSLPDTITYEQQIKICGVSNGLCYLTGDEDVHIEHAIPLSIGHGGTTLGNCYLLRGDLNFSKGDSNIFEWFEANRQRFDLSQERFDNLISFLAKANGISFEEYREFVYWCHANPRTVDEVKADNKRYGYKKPSIEIWREQRTEACA